MSWNPYVFNESEIPEFNKAKTIKKRTVNLRNINEQANAKIYLWNYLGVKAGVGHLSMSLSDGTYISHWPPQDKNTINLLLKPASQNESLEADIEAEEREPDKTLEIYQGIIDEQKIKNWWLLFKESSKYHLLSNNCAQTVQRAFRHGMMKPAYNNINNIILKNAKKMFPITIYSWIEDYNEEYQPFQECGLTNLITTSYMFKRPVKNNEDEDVEIYEYVSPEIRDMVIGYNHESVKLMSRWDIP